MKNTKIFFIGISLFLGASSMSWAGQPSETYSPAIVEIAGGGNLQSDGQGQYIDEQDILRVGVDRVKQQGNSISGFSLEVRNSGPGENRYLIHDLDDPVPGGGASQNYLLGSPDTVKHITLPYPLNSSTDGLLDMAIGSTENTNAEFRIKDPSLGFLTIIFGGGVETDVDSDLSAPTTQIQVTRNSSTEWTVSIPSGSICNLIDRNKRRLNSLGLFYYSGEISVNLK